MAGTPIDDLINTLYEMVEDAWSMPLGNDRCVLEREKVLDILDEVRANLPSDLKMAREIVEKRNDIIAAGKKEYENLKKQADDYRLWLLKYIPKCLCLNAQRHAEHHKGQDNVYNHHTSLAEVDCKTA